MLANCSRAAALRNTLPFTHQCRELLRQLARRFTVSQGGSATAPDVAGFPSFLETKTGRHARECTPAPVADDTVTPPVFQKQAPRLLYT